jgi:ribosomal protein S18 acetylase RimI-like enzyme
MIDVTSPSGELSGWLPGLEEFCATHPVAGMTPELVDRMLRNLVRGPDAVLDVRADGARVAVAAVIDTCANADDSADLVLLGQVAGGLDAVGVDALVASAEDRVRGGPRAILDVPLDPPRESWNTVLEARGYREAYAMFAMVRPAERPQPAARVALPPGWRWQRLDDERLADYHRVVVAAFAAVPGAHVPPLEEMVQAMKRRQHRPSVLVGDGAVRAFADVVVHDTTGGRVGELRFLGRDPALRGRGLGDHIVLHAMAECLLGDVTRLELEVAVRNRSALVLYERHGFRVVRRMPVLRRLLAPARASE